jgi:hypothetical protein
MRNRSDVCITLAAMAWGMNGFYLYQWIQSEYGLGSIG